MHTKRALVACCAGFYDRQVSLLSCSLETKPIAFLFEVIAWITRTKRTWRSTRHINTAFFRRLLHHRVCTRVACASQSLTVSWSLFLSRGIENGQLLQYGHAYQLSVCANVKTMDARMCTRGMVRKQKRSHIKRNGPLTFYWPLLYSWSMINDSDVLLVLWLKIIQGSICTCRIILFMAHPTRYSDWGGVARSQDSQCSFRSPVSSY